MTRWLTITVIVLVPAVVTAQNLTADSVLMQNVIGAVQIQRNTAQDQLAVANAQLAIAHARIAELEKQLAEAKSDQQGK